MYPALADIPTASYRQLGVWMRFLPSPETEDQVAALDLISKRFYLLGGWTSEMSKAVGWDIPSEFKRVRWADGP